ncbi:MAG: hypothetical protein KatS3mg105_3462 [Gemmatales bacterium]|nr:MAG: hypothetical protein KatS3mg105_3462 [Gemmatales bacterium]
MSEQLAVDHIVVRVDDLSEASRAYEALGFTVTPGGRHPGLGSENALVCFADGVYLELIAFARPVARQTNERKQQRMRRLADAGRPIAVSRHCSWEEATAGLVDFALVPKDLGVAIREAKRRGLSLHGPFPGGRKRPDGEEVAWQLAVAETFDLPFLCADVTPRSLRVPAGEASRHANGAVGLARLAVAVENLETSRRRYQALLGDAFRLASSAESNEPDSCSFKLGNVTIVLVGPNHPLFQEAGGDEGPCAVWLKRDQRASRTSVRMARDGIRFEE